MLGCNMLLGLSTAAVDVAHLAAGLKSPSRGHGCCLIVHMAAVAVMVTVEACQMLTTCGVAFCRPTATALMSFLAHAGYRMAAVYGRQFHKVMEHITQHYLPALEAKATKDVDLRAVGTRLQTYVSTRQYTKEPEGKTLKKVDESSYTRA